MSPSADVIPFRSGGADIATHTPPSSAKEILHGSGEPPDNGGMEARIIKLEGLTQEMRDRLTRIEARLDTFPALLASKEDLHKEISAQTWKLVTFVCSFATALVGATYFIAKYVH